MKILILILAALTSSAAFADKFVNGYVRKDGTYVAPHLRSSPDQYRSNNYGSQTFGGSQRDEFSSNPATNRGNAGYNMYDNDNDGQSNSYDNTPNGGSGWR